MRYAQPGGGTALHPDTDWWAGVGYRPVGPGRLTYQGLLLGTPCVRVADGAPVTVHTVPAGLDRASVRRVRGEAAELEAALAAHPNPYLVPLVDHGRTPDGGPLLVTAPYGEPLGGAGPLAPDEVRRAAAACGSALHLLHRAGLLHRGIAPEAVLRYPDGRLLLGCPLPAALAELVAATPGGTGHEPPEVLAGGDWAPAGEVYALASTLWTLLAGQPPMAGGREERLVRLLGGGGPQPAVLRRTDLAPHLVTALRRGLASEPGDRPATPAQLVGPLVDDDAPADDVATAASTHPPVQDEGAALGRRYVKVGLLGSGSAGEVWRVRRRSDGAAFAAKVLRAELSHDADAVHRLLTEQRLLTKLAHPNLVRVHDIVADEDVAIVMELVDGPNLRQLVAGRQLDRAEGLRLLSQVAGALAAVHGAGVLHRDLKPANVLVSGPPGNRTARLTDLGIAKVLDEPTRTRTGYVLGTYAYLAPEVVTGNEPLTPAADVYALGITAYEVLTGSRPFSGDMAELLDAHVRREPPRPPGLPDPLWALLAACLGRRPQARPTAAAAAAAFAGDGLPVPLAEPPVAPLAAPTELGRRPLPPPPVSAVPRRRRRWPLAAALVAVIALGGGLGTWLATRSPGGGRPAASPSPTVTGSTAAHYYYVAATARPNPDGSITVSWPQTTNRLPGLRGYIVQRRPDNQVSQVLHVLSYRDLDVAPNQCYQYAVLAYGVPIDHPAAPASTCSKDSP